MSVKLSPDKAVRYAQQLINRQNIEGAKGQLGSLSPGLQQRLEALIQEQGSSLPTLLGKLSAQGNPESVKLERQILLSSLGKLRGEIRYSFPITNRREIEPDPSEKLDADGLRRTLIAFAAARINFNYLKYRHADTFGGFFTALSALPSGQLEQFVKACRQKFANLTSVELADVLEEYADEFCGLLVKICPKLEEVVITQSSITAAAIVDLAGSSVLTTLSLYDCPKIQNGDLQFLRNCAHLTTLKLTSMDRITNDGLEFIARYRTLRTLELEDLNNITTDGVLHLEGCPTLERCSIKECGYISMSFREEFQEGLLHRKEQRLKMKSSLSVTVESPLPHQPIQTTREPMPLPSP